MKPQTIEAQLLSMQLLLQTLIDELVDANIITPENISNRIETLLVQLNAELDNDDIDKGNTKPTPNLFELFPPIVGES
jgi:hypothetical protein